MLTQVELDFCEAVKQYSQENSGKQTKIATVCAPNSTEYILRLEVPSYERVKLIMHKILGENYDERLANRDEDFKHCKAIEVLLVGV